MVAAHTDPYLHPLIYDFIKHASEFFPHKKITTVSTGSYISEDKIDYLLSFPNFGIDLSLVTMQEQRETIVPRPTRERLETLLREGPITSLIFIQIIINNGSYHPVWLKNIPLAISTSIK